MKYATLALMGIGLAIGSSFAIGQAPSPKGEPEMKTTEQKFAYAIGLSIGRNMKTEDVGLDPELIYKGMKDALADKPALTDAQLAQVQKDFQQIMMAKQQAAQANAQGNAAKNLEEGKKFLAENKTKPGVTTLPNGLQYKVLKAGTGKTPKLGEEVTVNYRGTVPSGAEFDSSYKRNEPFSFTLGGRVITGWNEIIQKMKVGDKWEVYIPTEMAYGAEPRPGSAIKPNDPLIFEIELLKVK